MTWYNIFIYPFLSGSLIFDWDDNRGEAPAGKYLVRKIQIYESADTVDSDSYTDILYYNWNPETSIYAMDKYDLYLEIFKMGDFAGFTPTSIHVKGGGSKDPFIFVLGQKNNGKFIPNMYSDYMVHRMVLCILGVFAGFGILLLISSFGVTV